MKNIETRTFYYGNIISQAIYFLRNNEDVVPHYITMTFDPDNNSLIFNDERVDIDLRKDIIENIGHKASKNEPILQQEMIDLLLTLH